MNHRHVGLFAIALAACLSWSACATAQDTPSKPSASGQSNTATAPTFDQMDRNHDHWLTRSEIPHKMHYLRQHFGEADVTHDRKLSRGEYASFSAPLLDKNNASILNSKLRNSRSNISLPPQPTAMKH